MRMIRGAVDAGRLGVGVANTRGVHIAVKGVPQRRDILAGIDQRMAARGFLDADELLIKPHVARLGTLALQIIVPDFVGREIEPAGRMHAHRMAGGGFNFLVKVDRITLQARDIGIRADGVDLSSGMPARSTGEFVPFQQNDILPPELGQMKQD